MLDLSVVFLIGLLGSAHCVGMCGGFVILLAGAGGGHRSLLAYFAGKTSSYALLGALAGLLGGVAGLRLAGAQGLLSVALGLVLVAVGLGLCGVLGRIRGVDRVSGHLAARLGPAVRHLVQRDRPGAFWGLGALNGLLPCGLVYGMLAKAATTGSAGAGALTLAVFGLGTVPALALVGSVGRAISPTQRRWMQQLGGVLVIGLGVLTLTRAGHALWPSAPGAAPIHQLICSP